MKHNIWISLIVIILTLAVVNFWPLGQKYAQATEADRKSSQKKIIYNRLIDESSPYLLQHATNPVDWYPWGNEAFEKARKEDKPIFLSIGYSTCHWCLIPNLWSQMAARPPHMYA